MLPQAFPEWHSQRAATRAAILFPWALSRVICEMSRPFSVSPDSLGAPEESLRYVLQCGPLICPMSSDILCPSCCCCPVHSLRVHKPGSESQCSHQGNLCPESCCICSCQSCRTQSQPLSLLNCFLIGAASLLVTRTCPLGCTCEFMKGALYVNHSDRTFSPV